jgi:hypothetical protein
LIERLENETPKDQARLMLTTAYVLTGLRVQQETARQVFRKVTVMRESDTYLAILDEGSERQAKKTLLLLGQERFGPPSEAIKAQLEAITDLERLDRLTISVLRVSSWQELLETP